jgi:hypothetical protein
VFFDSTRQLVTSPKEERDLKSVLSSSVMDLNCQTICSPRTTQGRFKAIGFGLLVLCGITEVVFREETDKVSTGLWQWENSSKPCRAYGLSG